VRPLQDGILLREGVPEERLANSQGLLSLHSNQGGQEVLGDGYKQ